MITWQNFANVSKMVAGSPQPSTTTSSQKLEMSFALARPRSDTRSERFFYSKKAPEFLPALFLSAYIQRIKSQCCYTSITTGITIGLRSVSLNKNSPISSRSFCLIRFQSA